MTNPNVYPHQPEFADNRDENTLGAALIARIEHLCATALPPDLDVATGYFNTEGFGIPAARLEAPRSIRNERALRKEFTTVSLLASFASARSSFWRPPKPLPPIDRDDVTLVVWMAIESD